MTDQSSWNQLKESVHAAADLLRGRVSASEYKDYITALLFFKYVSDMREACVGNYGDVDKRYSELLSRLKLSAPDGNSFPSYSELWRAERLSDIGQNLNKVFRDLERANSVEFAGVFGLVDFDSNRLGNAKERGELLTSLMACLNPVTLVPPRGSFQRSNDFDFLNITLETLASHRHNTEHVTPTCVSKIMAHLMAPRHGDSILDPFCGTGTLLAECVTEANKFSAIPPRVFGVEKSGASWSIARMNAFVHGAEAQGIVLADAFSALATYERDEVQFDIIITNPPWALKAPINGSLNYEKYFSRHRIPKINGDYTALAAMLSVLDARRGRMALVVTNGFLTKGGAEQEMRQYLIDRNAIDAVISLPPRVFYNSSIAASILLLRMDKTSDEVLFIESAKDFTSLKGRNHLTEGAIEKLLTVFRDRTEIGGYSYTSSSSRISANDFNLSVSSYIMVEQHELQSGLAEIEEHRRTARNRLEEIEGRFTEFIIDQNL